MEKRFSYPEVRLLFREDDIYYLKDIFQQISILYPEVIVLFIREKAIGKGKNSLHFCVLGWGQAVGLCLEKIFAQCKKMLSLENEQLIQCVFPLHVFNCTINVSL